MKFSGFLAPLVLLGFFLALVVAGFFISQSNLGRSTEYKQAKMVIKEETFSVDIADRSAEQRQGLSGRASLGANEGMIFIFKDSRYQSFWMKGMKIPIDIIWIKGETVIGFEKNVQPESGVNMLRLRTYSSPEAVEKVLEVPAGTVERLDIQVGDKAVLSYN